LAWETGLSINWSLNIRWKQDNRCSQDYCLKANFDPENSRIRWVEEKADYYVKKPEL